MNIIIDGNDGCGKSTVIKHLVTAGYKNVIDRGLPTYLTDNLRDISVHNNKPTNDCFIILDCTAETSQKRLLMANKSLNEKYHTRKDLLKYRSLFSFVYKNLNNCFLVDTDGVGLDVVVRRCIRIIDSL